MTNRQATPDILDAIMAGPPPVPLQTAPSATPIAITAIVNDGGTQMRAGMNADTVKEYEDALADADAWPFPPIVVFHDGARYWLADGFHRLNAAHRSGKFQEIPADIKAGTRRDAVLFAAGANASHGLRRTNDDKNRAVKALLEDEEWSKWSDREIARRCAVSNRFVSNLRQELTVNGSQSPTQRTGADGRTINTANIGTNRSTQPAMLAVWELETTVREVYAQVYGGNPEPYATRDMRTGAQMRAGRFWLLCTQSLPANQFRVSDLVQAINNFAAQVEAKRDGTNAIRNPTPGDPEYVPPALRPSPPPASYTVPEAVADKPLPGWVADDSPAGAALEETLQRLAGPEQPAEPARDTPRNDLDQELTDALLRSYWSKSDLDRFARSASPYDACRRELVSGRKGMATSTWRIDSHHGKVRAWHISHGEDHWDREPDAVITYDRFARMTVGLSEVQTVAGATGTPGPEAQPEPAAPVEALPVSQRADYESDEWYTPAEYIEAAKAVMGAIDLDPASSEMAQTVVGATAYLTKWDDGLAQTRWIHQRIWLNPPYSNPGPWIEKLVREHQAGPFCTEAIVLCNNATETSWFQLLLERFPVCLPARRLAFWRHDHANVGARQGQAFFYLGPNTARFQEIFSQFGPILRRLS